MVLGVVAAVGVTVPAAGAGGLDWGACPFDAGESGARCATVSVPLDYARPGGTGIDIHISRAPSAHPERRRGVLMVHEGGPGPHLADASTFRSLAPAELTDAYDIVTFDQRGFGTSAPVHCGLRPDRQFTIPWTLPGGPPAERDRARGIGWQVDAVLPVAP
jgi:pimeloyl-ACP methyl ester carboxylesterase